MEHLISKLLQEFEQGKMTRRDLVRMIALTAAAAVNGAAAQAQSASPAKAVNFNHISYQVANYRRSRDFYSSLFGMKVTEDDGKDQCRLEFGDGILVVRNASSRPGAKVGIDHIAYTLANWDADKNVKPAVVAEMKRRGIAVEVGEIDLHITDPDGLTIQMGGKRQ